MSVDIKVTADTRSATSEFNKLKQLTDKIQDGINKKGKGSTLYAADKDLQSVKSVKTALDNLKAGISRNNLSLINSNELSKTLNQVRGINAEVGRLNQSIDKIGNIAKVAFNAAVVTAFGASALDTAKSFESLRKRLEIVTGSLIGAERAFGAVQTMAAKTKFTVRTLTDGYARLATTGHELLNTQGEVLTALKALSNTITAIGGSDVEFERVAVAFERMASEGRVTRERLNQLADAGVPLTKLFNELGYTQTELVRKLDAGQVTFTEVYTAFKRLAFSSKGFGKAASDNVTSLSTAFSNLKDAVETFQDTIINRTGLNKIIISFVVGITNAIYSFTDVAARSLSRAILYFEIFRIRLSLIAEKLDKVIGGTFKFLSSLDFSKLVPDLSKFTINLNKFLPGLQGVADKIFKFGEFVKKVFYNIWDAVVGHSYWPDTIKGIVEWAGKLKSMVEPKINQFAEYMRDVFLDIKDALEYWSVEIKYNLKISENSGIIYNINNALKTLGNVIRDFYDQVSSDVGRKQMKTDVIDTTSTAFKPLGESLVEFYDQLRSTEGRKQLMIDIGDAIKLTLTNISDAVVSFYDQVRSNQGRKQLVADAFDFIGDSVEKLSEKAKQLQSVNLEKAGPAIDAFSRLFGQISNFASVLGVDFAKALSKLEPKEMKQFRLVLGRFQNDLQQIIDNVSSRTFKENMSLALDAVVEEFGHGLANSKIVDNILNTLGESVGRIVQRMFGPEFTTTAAEDIQDAIIAGVLLFNKNFRTIGLISLAVKLVAGDKTFTETLNSIAEDIKNFGNNVLKGLGLEGFQSNPGGFVVGLLFGSMMLMIATGKMGTLISAITKILAEAFILKGVFGVGQVNAAQPGATSAGSTLGKVFNTAFNAAALIGGAMLGGILSDKITAELGIEDPWVKTLTQVGIVAATAFATQWVIGTAFTTIVGWVTGTLLPGIVSAIFASSLAQTLLAVLIPKYAAVKAAISGIVATIAAGLSTAALFTALGLVAGVGLIYLALFGDENDSGINGKITRFVRNLGKMFQDWGRSLGDSLYDGLKGVLDRIRGTFDSLPDFIKDFFRGKTNPGKVAKPIADLNDYSFMGQNYAAGGSISGPGTGTSDSILARVSNGEFIVNAKSTSQNLDLLQRINKGLPAFKDGGLVGYSFVKGEEGTKLNGYVPNMGVSGVTIASGLDLGQQSMSRLRSFGILDSVISKLAPYVGLKGRSASLALANKPLRLSKEEIDHIDAQVMPFYAREAAAAFNAVSPGKNFTELPFPVRTALFSAFYQHGNFTNHRWLRDAAFAAGRGDYNNAASSFRLAPAYRERRAREASLIQSAIKQSIDKAVSIAAPGGAQNETEANKFVKELFGSTSSSDVSNNITVFDSVAEIRDSLPATITDTTGLDEGPQLGPRKVARTVVGRILGLPAYADGTEEPIDVNQILGKDSLIPTEIGSFDGGRFIKHENFNLLSEAQKQAIKSKELNDQLTNSIKTWARTNINEAFGNSATTTIDDIVRKGALENTPISLDSTGYKINGAIRRNKLLLNVRDEDGKLSLVLGKSGNVALEAQKELYGGSLRGSLSKDRLSVDFSKRFASGGQVSGPGTSRSDSILARLSNGEFVVNAQATSKNLDLLQRLNSGLPAFANGTPSAVGKVVGQVNPAGGRQNMTVAGNSFTIDLTGFIDKVRELTEANQDLKANSDLLAIALKESAKTIKGDFLVKATMSAFSESELSDALKNASGELKNLGVEASKIKRNIPGLKASGKDDGLSELGSKASSLILKSGIYSDKGSLDKYLKDNLTESKQKDLQAKLLNLEITTENLTRELKSGNSSGIAQFTELQRKYAQDLTEFLQVNAPPKEEGNKKRPFISTQSMEVGTEFAANFNNSVTEGFKSYLKNKESFAVVRDAAKLQFTSNVIDAFVGGFVKGFTGTFLNSLSKNLMGSQAEIGTRAGEYLSKGINAITSLFSGPDESNAEVAGEDPISKVLKATGSDLSKPLPVVVVEGAVSKATTGVSGTGEKTPLEKGMESVKSKFEEISSDFKGTFDNIGKNISSVFGSIVSGLGGAFDSIKGLFSGGMDSLGSLGSASDLGGDFDWSSLIGLAFDSGGVVPGPIGSPQIAMVHSGETILPTHKKDIGSFGNQQVYNINITGDISRQTKTEIYRMLPSITANVNQINRENNYK